MKIKDWPPVRPAELRIRERATVRQGDVRVIAQRVLPRRRRRQAICRRLAIPAAAPNRDRSRMPEVGERGPGARPRATDLQSLSCAARPPSRRYGRTGDRAARGGIRCLAGLKAGDEHVIRIDHATAAVDAGIVLKSGSGHDFRHHPGWHESLGVMLSGHGGSHGIDMSAGPKRNVIECKVNTRS